MTRTIAGNYIRYEKVENQKNRILGIYQKAISMIECLTAESYTQFYYEVRKHKSFNYMIMFVINRLFYFLYFLFFTCRFCYFFERKNTRNICKGNIIDILWATLVSSCLSACPFVFWSFGHIITALPSFWLLSFFTRGCSSGGDTRALARPLFFRENNFFYQIKRFNSLAKMSVHKDTLDSLSVIHIANEFVKLQPERQNIFGAYPEQDL